MNDYFKHIINPESNIFNYQIANNEIIIYTINKQKRVKRKLKLTKKNIKECEKTLEYQYQDAIIHKTDIIKNQCNRKNNIYMILSLIICFLSAISAEFFEPLGIFLCIASMSTLLINLVDVQTYNKKLYEQFKIYSEFLKQQHNIESHYNKSKEIVENIDKKTKNIIQQNIQLKEQELIENIFNIDFMDKATLKSLKQILKNYQYIEENKNKVRKK